MIKNKMKYAVPAFLASGTVLLADAADDAAAIVTTATTVFGTVAALSVTIVAFYIIIRMVKGIRK